MTNGRSKGSRSLATSVSRKNGSVIPATAAESEVPIEQRAPGTARDGGHGDARLARGGCKSIRERPVHIGPPRGVRGTVKNIDTRHGLVGERSRGVRRHGRGIELQLLFERHAAVVQSPQRQKRQVQHRRRQQQTRDQTLLAPRRARPTQAAHGRGEHDQPHRGEREQYINQRERGAIRERGEDLLQHGVHARRIHALHGGRRDRHRSGERADRHQRDGGDCGDPHITTITSRI